ncbi:MAG TPA: c-type cytochrome biogenesis protein CcmI [Alphaproteobacteria bacterium]
MIWAVLALMTLAAAAAIVLPYLRARGAAPARASYDLEIYRDQLAEVERDQARGLIGDAEAKAARTEIARRALAADAAIRQPGAPAARPAPRFAFVAAAAIAPVLALGLYLTTGSPRLPSQEFLAAHVDDGKQEREMVARLEARLHDHPEDVQGWLLLARSYATLGRSEESVKAWREAIQRSPDPTPLAGAFGEALVQAAGGMVTPEAAAQFATAQRADPTDPRPRYYLGLTQAQAGQSRDALQVWTDLVAVSPADAPWVPAVRDQITRLAAQAKIDPAAITPSAEAQTIARQAQSGPGPSSAAVAAAEKMSPEERTAMIRSMVDSLAARLDANPDDVEGWVRLGRARQVLGEPDKSVEAYAKAAAVAPDRLDVQSAYADALFRNMPKSDKLAPEFVAVMRHILDLDPNYGDALWFVGLAEAESGNRLAAVALWQRLLDRLPAGSKERDQVQAQIDRTKQATD